MLRGRVGTRQDGEVSKQITKKVQNQGQKHNVFDLAHGPSNVRCSVYGVVVEIDTCTCSRRLVHVSSWLGRLWVPIHTRIHTGAIHWLNTKAFLDTSINDMIHLSYVSTPVVGRSSPSTPLNR